jgi:hypothetical protein
MDDHDELSVDEIAALTGRHLSSPDDADPERAAFQKDKAALPPRIPGHTDVLEWLTATLADVEREAHAAAAAAPAPWTAEQWQDMQGRTRDTANIVTSAPPEHVLALKGGYLWDDEGATSLQAPLAAVVHVAAWDPAAVLAAVEADRAILAESASWGHYDCGSSVPRDCCCADRPAHDPCSCGLDDRRLRLRRLVASRYAHRPGYDEAWKP